MACLRVQESEKEPHRSDDVERLVERLIADFDLVRSEALGLGADSDAPASVANACG